jgi:hypothetical protein
MPDRCRLLCISLISLVALPIFAQQSCAAAADEPHHKLLVQGSGVRIFMVELNRLETTDRYCSDHPFLRVAVSAGEASNLQENAPPVSHTWRAGEALFVSQPENHVLRNDRGDPFTELEIEDLSSQSARHTPQECDYNGGEGVRPCYEPRGFPVDPGDVGTWTVSFHRRGLTVYKSRLSPGDSITMGDGSHLLLALTPAKLKLKIENGDEAGADLQPQQSIVLPAGAKRTITNTGRDAAKLISVEF